MKQGVVQRRLTLGYYKMGAEGAAPESRIDLVVKFPDDLKRERLPFVLRALDLF
jgi:hypothetical protein